MSSPASGSKGQTRHGDNNNRAGVLHKTYETPKRFGEELMINILLAMSR